MAARPNEAGVMVGTCPHCGAEIVAEQIDGCEVCDGAILTLSPHEVDTVIAVALGESFTTADTMPAPSGAP